MKAEVVIDDAGNIVAMLHPAADSGEPLGALKPSSGQHSAILEIPHSLQHLRPLELHDAVRVEIKGGAPPRLVPR
jgi:hypothetical protein